MIYYNINALYHKEFLELASICSAFLIKNGNVKKEQIRVTITRNLKSCVTELIELSNIIGYNGIRILNKELTGWSPKTHIINFFEYDADDYVVNIDADCFLTKEIELNDYVEESNRNSEIALYEWPTNAYNSYINRLTLAQDFFKPSINSRFQYESLINGIIKESNISIGDYEDHLKQNEKQWINGGFTIYSYKGFIRYWETLTAINCLILSDEYAISLLSYLYNHTEYFGLKVNILQSKSDSLPHHYLPPSGKMEEKGLLHLVGATKKAKENEIKELYRNFVIDH